VLGRCSSIADFYQPVDGLFRPSWIDQGQRCNITEQQGFELIRLDIGNEPAWLAAGLGHHICMKLTSEQIKLLAEIRYGSGLLKARKSLVEAVQVEQSRDHRRAVQPQGIAQVAFDPVVIQRATAMPG